MAESPTISSPALPMSWALKTRADLAIAIAAFLSLFLLGAPFPLVVLGAAVIGLLRARNGTAAPPQIDHAQPSARGAFFAASIWSVAWLAPLALSFVALAATATVASSW